MLHACFSHLYFRQSLHTLQHGLAAIADLLVTADSFWHDTLRFDLQWSKLYQIWAKSSNQQRSYCDFNIWPNDLEQLSHVALLSEIICTKSELGQPIHSWLTAFFCWYIMSRSDPDLWPLDLERVWYIGCSVQTLYQTSVKSINEG